MISSKSWRMNPAVKPELASKKKANTTFEAKQQANTDTSEQKTNLQSKMSAGSGKGSTGGVWKHSGLHGIEGMAWIEEVDDNKEEKIVRGSSLLEEDETGKNTQPQYIFEEIFGFGK